MNNAIERCKAQQEAVAFECTRKAFFEACKGACLLFAQQQINPADKLLKLVYCALLQLLFNVNAKETIRVHAETVTCTCMSRPWLWMLGIASPIYLLLRKHINKDSVKIK